MNSRTQGTKEGLTGLIFYLNNRLFGRDRFVRQDLRLFTSCFCQVIILNFLEQWIIYQTILNLHITKPVPEVNLPHCVSLLRTPVRFASFEDKQTLACQVYDVRDRINWIGRNATGLHSYLLNNDRLVLGHELLNKTSKSHVHPF